MNKEELAAALRAEARRLGANLVGIAPAALPAVYAGGPKDYEAWVEKGMHGEMGYMARAKDVRSEIQRWFPPARSVVVCAFSYHGGSPPPAPDPARGRLARYSLPPDYHEEIKERIARLLDWYRRAVPGGRGKIFVDTSPVLERLYARYAGVGWVGKNTMLISRKIGSFFFLSGLALDCELPYDDPVPDHCGSCSRCLRACPTEAFTRPRVLDATRCIAYFTVEQRKSPIPEEHREGVGNWIFGCDVCQDVCPWNRFSAKSSVLEPRLDPVLSLEELARMTREEFEERFKDSPMLRTGYSAFLRNVLLAMGNSRQSRFAPILERFAEDPDPLLSEQARWSLARLDLPAAPEILI